MKRSLSKSIIALAALSMLACKPKASEPTETTESTETTETTVTTTPLNLTPENLKALVYAETWNPAPQALLDDMGVKQLEAFEQEMENAQCDNISYYYGKGVSLELNEHGGLKKVAVNADDAVIIHLTAESMAQGYIAFHSKADYEAFLKKTKGKTNEQMGLEYEDEGTDAEWIDALEQGKWYLISFLAME